MTAERDQGEATGQAAKLSTDEYVALASRMTGSEFATYFAKLDPPIAYWLIYYANVDAVGASSFATQIVSKDVARQKPTNQLHVVPLAKGKNNPYQDRISVGRARNCDVVLRNPSISKLHAHIRREPNGSFVIIDQNSHNGTAVGGIRVPPSQPVPLRVGEQLTIGGMLVRLIDANQLHQVLTDRSPWGPLRA
ncbi:MAG: FHA domain-containing protein [Polyangia bacterium]